MILFLSTSQLLPFSENANNLHRLDISARLSRHHGSLQMTHLSDSNPYHISNGSRSVILKVDKGVVSWTETNHGNYCMDPWFGNLTIMTMIEV